MIKLRKKTTIMPINYQADKAKDNIKRIAFIAIGISIAIAIFYLTKPTVSQASIKPGKQFEDWIVTCDDVPEKQLAEKESPEKGKKKQKTTKICYLTQALSVKSAEEEKHQIRAIYNLGYVEGKLMLFQKLPLGINVEAGTVLQSKKEIVAKGVFKTCMPDGCLAAADISDKALASIIEAGKENVVGLLTAENKMMHLLFSAKGLKAGLAYIKK